jgi:hypothetical protein
VTSAAGRRIAGTAAALLALAVSPGCSADDRPAELPTSTTAVPAETTAPRGPPPGATERGLRELEIGDCFDRIDEPEVGDRAVWRLDCADPHTREVYDLVAYEGEGATGGTPYPGVAVVQDWAEQACYDRFEAFVGVRWTLSELEIEVWWPSEESWGRGDRSVICTVMSSTGNSLLGSQRGVAR